MLKNISKLECLVNDKPIWLLCDPLTTTVELRAAIKEYLSFLDKIEENAKKAADESAKQNASISEGIVEEAMVIE